MQEKKIENASKKIEQTASNKIEQIVSEKKETSRNKIAYIPHFKAYLDNLTKLLTTPLGKSLPRNIMTEKLSHVLLPTEIGGSK